MITALLLPVVPLWAPPAIAEGNPILSADAGLPDYARRLEAIVDVYPRLPAIVADVFAHPNGVQPAMSPLRLGYGLTLLFAAGVLALIVARRLLRRQEIVAPVLRLTAGLAELAAFSLGTLLAYALMRPPHPAAPAILLAVLKLVATILLTDRILRLLTAPEDQAHRLLPLDTPAAHGLQNTAMVVVALIAGPLGLLDLLRALGLPQDAVLALGLPLGTLPFLYLLWVVWRHRVAVIRTLVEPLNLDARSLPLLGVWPALATLHLLGLWLIAAGAALRQEPQAGERLLASLLLAFCVPLVALVLTRPLSRLYHGNTNDAGAPDDSSPQVARLMRAILLAMIVLGVVGTAMIWGYGLDSVGGPSAFLMRLLFNLSVVLLLGYVAWVLMVRVIDRALSASQRGNQSTRAQRMATLLPLLRKVLQVMLVVSVMMIVLSSLGIEIGPLLAGAGVVGIAIGLGAQSTIADILAGVFFLLEDAFRMGDYVEVGQLRGTVEGISLRSLKLRHHRGAVHTLPFGQIKALTNYSRDWALIRLEFRVPPETDLDLVKKLVKDIGKQLASDPETGPNLIEPLKSQGVRRVEDDALIIGVKFTAKPDEQFVIRREAYQRLIRAFNLNGIHLVGRGVVVRVDDPKAATTALGFAAQEAIREKINMSAD
ncbi:mechanosensitive ion channel family protein [Azospirillum sp. CT11-132]|uniref:mechanosensitive ion channel family protein n=1 Tax=Azospirillum sp. CT11-132 TaxID=3396317 RepID=UPI0039A47D57